MIEAKRIPDPTGGKQALIVLMMPVDDWERLIAAMQLANQLSTFVDPGYEKPRLQWDYR